jgi:hypothetical protein
MYTGRPWGVLGIRNKEGLEKCELSAGRNSPPMFLVFLAEYVSANPGKPISKCGGVED